MSGIRLIGKAVPAKKPYGARNQIDREISLYPNTIGILKIQYSDSELKKTKETFPESTIEYDKNKNKLNMILKIIPCHYVEDKNQSSGWRIDDCTKNEEKVVEDEYHIEIDLNSKNVYELDGKIKKTGEKLNKTDLDMHLYPDSNSKCCLGIEIEDKEVSLSNYIREYVYPYFVWQAYYAKYEKTPPVGEYSHGSEGISEARDDYKQTMQQSHKRGSARNKPCPCGSGKKYKKCCWHQDNQKEIDLKNFRNRKPYS